MRLLTTSVGNSSGELTMDAAAVAAGVDAAVVADGAGAAGVGVMPADAAGVDGSVAAEAAAAGFTTAFFALAIMTTKKSFGLILQLSMTSSSFNTLPEWISFMPSAGNSDLAAS
jgi:hypothetical protein